MEYLFYVFDEHTDYVEELKSIGMENISSDDTLFTYHNLKYQLLGRNDC